MIFLFMAAGILLADDAQNKKFFERADMEFRRTQVQFQTADNSTNAAEFARACFDLANVATNSEERAAVSRAGIDACRKSIARWPESAPAHYYLGMNLGELARTESVGALKIVREMEREFKIAATLDPELDFAGPERCLGLLYRDAPGWPISIGSKRRAKNFLEQAAWLAPDFPENILNLAESDLKWRDEDAAKKEWAALDALWPQAQKNFSGEKWERDWADWTARRDAVRQKLQGIAASKSPRER